MLRILIVQDKLGITEAYKSHWNMMCLRAGLMQPWIQFKYTSAWREFRQDELLMFKHNRKSPGFNIDPAKQVKLLNWLKGKMDLVNAGIVVLQDPTFFFIVNNNWDQATTDNLRGGVYTMKNSRREDITVLVTAPIHSINTQMKAKDIAALNQGFAERDEFEEVFGGDDETDSDDDDDDDAESSETRTMEWYNPIIVPFGRHCFQSDLYKLGRLARKWKVNHDGLIESGLSSR